MIGFHEVTIKFGDKTILENITAKIKKGELVSIIEPNGAGKTTLIKVLLGFIKLNSGFVKINNLSPLVNAFACCRRIIS